MLISSVDMWKSAFRGCRLHPFDTRKKNNVGIVEDNLWYCFSLVPRFRKKPLRFAPDIHNLFPDYSHTFPQSFPLLRTLHTSH